MGVEGAQEVVATSHNMKEKEDVREKIPGLSPPFKIWQHKAERRKKGVTWAWLPAVKIDSDIEKGSTPDSIGSRRMQTIAGINFLKKRQR